MHFLLAGLLVGTVHLSFGCDAAAQSTREGSVDAGRQIRFQLTAWDVDPDSVKVAVSPEGVTDASFDGYFLRIRGIKHGKANVRVSGRAGDPGMAFTETFAITVGDAQPQSYLPPKTVRDYFMLLPEEYFVLEGCKWETDQDCEQARNEYLSHFLEVYDTQNGYLKGGCDGAQNCLEMAIFRKPDGSHVVGLTVTFEAESRTRFLEYSDSKWADATARVIPEFSEDLHYELPRNGTTIRVLAKVNRIDEEGTEVTELGDHLFSLKWDEGRFVRAPISR
jgi:hypothetical protein